MDRLTCKNTEDWNVLSDVSNFDKEGKVKETPQCNEICNDVSYCEDCPIQRAINKLADYEDAEEQGLLVELPCKIGTPVWTIMSGMSHKNPTIFRQNFELSLFEHFGKAVFLTKEEAEQALAEMKGGKNGQIDNVHT